jgi:hypothetical protein
LRLNLFMMAEADEEVGMTPRPAYQAGSGEFDAARVVGWTSDVLARRAQRSKMIDGIATVRLKNVATELVKCELTDDEAESLEAVRDNHGELNKVASEILRRRGDAVAVVSDAAVDRGGTHFAYDNKRCMQLSMCPFDYTRDDAARDFADRLCRFVPRESSRPGCIWIVRRRLSHAQMRELPYERGLRVVLWHRFVTSRNDDGFEQPGVKLLARLEFDRDPDADLTFARSAVENAANTTTWKAVIGDSVSDDDDDDDDDDSGRSGGFPGVQLDEDTRGHFEALGLSPGASQTEIRRNFLRFSRKNHPDKDGDAAKFRRVKEAYDALYELGVSADEDVSGDEEVDEAAAAARPNANSAPSFSATGRDSFGEDVPLSPRTSARQQRPAREKHLCGCGKRVSMPGGLFHGNHASKCRHAQSFNFSAQGRPGTAATVASVEAAEAASGERGNLGAAANHVVAGHTLQALQKELAEDLSDNGSDTEDDYDYCAQDPPAAQERTPLRGVASALPPGGFTATSSAVFSPTGTPVGGAERVRQNVARRAALVERLVNSLSTQAPADGGRLHFLNDEAEGLHKELGTLEDEMRRDIRRFHLEDEETELELVGLPGFLQMGEIVYTSDGKACEVLGAALGRSAAMGRMAVIYTVGKPQPTSLPFGVESISGRKPREMQSTLLSSELPPAIAASMGRRRVPPPPPSPAAGDGSPL